MDIVDAFREHKEREAIRAAAKEALALLSRLEGDRALILPDGDRFVMKARATLTAGLTYRCRESMPEDW